MRTERQAPRNSSGMLNEPAGNNSVPKMPCLDTHFPFDMPHEAAGCMETRFPFWITASSSRLTPEGFLQLPPVAVVGSRSPALASRHMDGAHL